MEVRHELQHDAGGRGAEHLRRPELHCPAYGGKLLVWSVDRSGASEPSPAAPKKGEAEAGVGTPSKQNAGGARSAGTRPLPPQRNEGA